MPEKNFRFMATVAYKWLLLCSFWMLTAFQGEERRMKGALHSPLSTLLSHRHPLYVSVTEINHNAAEKSLEISVKVFHDDLEQIIEKNNNAQLDILAEKDKSRFNQYIPSYFQKNLVLTVDGKQLSLTYVGFEVEKESAFCYFEVENITSVKKIDVTNSILYDFNDTEMNIMHGTVNGNRKSSKVNHPEKAASFEF